MKYSKILGLILCTLAIASNAYAKECFIISENTKVIHVVLHMATKIPLVIGA